MSGDIRAAIFVKRLRPLIGTNLLRFRPRNQLKTTEFLLDNDLQESDLLEMVSALTADHYADGPSEERDGRYPPGQIMVFYYHWEGIRLYIKIKLLQDGSIEVADILSAHPEGMHDE